MTPPPAHPQGWHTLQLWSLFPWLSILPASPPHSLPLIAGFALHCFRAVTLSPVPPQPHALSVSITAETKRNQDGLSKVFPLAWEKGAFEQVHQRFSNWKQHLNDPGIFLKGRLWCCGSRAGLETLRVRPTGWQSSAGLGVSSKVPGSAQWEAGSQNWPGAGSKSPHFYLPPS